MKQIKTLQDLQDVYRKHYNLSDDITGNDVFKYSYTAGRIIIDETKFLYKIEEELPMTENNISFMKKYAVDPKDIMFTLKCHAISDIDGLVKLLAGYEYREDNTMTPTFYKR